MYVADLVEPGGASIASTSLGRTTLPMFDVPSVAVNSTFSTVSPRYVPWGLLRLCGRRRCYGSIGMPRFLTCVVCRMLLVGNELGTSFARGL